MRPETSTKHIEEMFKRLGVREVPHGFGWEVDGNSSTVMLVEVFEYLDRKIRIAHADKKSWRDLSNSQEESLQSYRSDFYKDREIIKGLRSALDSEKETVKKLQAVIGALRAENDKLKTNNLLSAVILKACNSLELKPSANGASREM